MSLLSPSSFLTHQLWRLPDFRVKRRLQIVLAVLRHGKFSPCIRVPIARSIWPPQSLRIDFSLQSHERFDQRLWPRWTTGDMHIYRQIAIDALKHVVSLLE